MRRISLLIAMLLSACLLLLPASFAAARIVPQKGIMGINLKMTGTRVIQKKGMPDGERVVQNEILGRQRILRYDKTRAGLSGPKRSDRSWPSPPRTEGSAPAVESGSALPRPR
jgi:hypothetical protein